MIKATLNLRTLQTGLSLLEVLITLIVLGMGLVSLAKFQGTVLQENSLAKARTVAAHLAEEKVDDLRAYDALVPPPPIPPSPTRYAYSTITTPNMGGRIAAISSGTALTISNVPYTRTWTVSDYCFSGGHNTPAVSGGCPAGLPDFKMVTVTVGWTDQDGVAQTVTLNTIISKSPPER